jgi:hypothetical protein
VYSVRGKTLLKYSPANPNDTNPIAANTRAAYLCGREKIELEIGVGVPVRDIG